MKTFWTALFVSICVLTVITLAQTPAELTKAGFSTEQIEENYLRGLNSDVPGLQVSCAYFLGEMRSEKAVIPLMKMFRNKDAAPGQRIMAAWSLMKIGDERGLYLLKCEADNPECDYLRCLSEFLYKDHCYKTEGRLR